MQETSNIRIHTLFYWCNDVVAMRHFYTDLIGLKEAYFRNDEAHGWITYSVADVDIAFMRASEPLPIPTTWAKQPSLPIGTLENPSVLIAVSPEEFITIVNRLKSADVPSYEDDPTAKQFFVRDPMGTTVEIYVA